MSACTTSGIATRSRAALLQGLNTRRLHDLAPASGLIGHELAIGSTREESDIGTLSGQSFVQIGTLHRLARYRLKFLKIPGGVPAGVCSPIQCAR